MRMDTLVMAVGSLAQTHIQKRARMLGFLCKGISGSMQPAVEPKKNHRTSMNVYGASFFGGERLTSTAIAHRFKDMPSMKPDWCWCII